MLDSAGAAQPDTGTSVAVRVIQGFVTVVGIAIIPLVTAVVVESAVTAGWGAGRAACRDATTSSSSVSATSARAS